MDFEAVHKYIDMFSSEEEALLAKINRETWLKVLNPRMITGKVQGQFLKTISVLNTPKYILELGTFTGYSAICLAAGLQKEGQLHTIEKNDEVLLFAQRNFQDVGLSDRIVAHHGDAMKIIPELKYDWDVVFLDADKIRYLEYYQLLINNLKPGALIIADNVLWSGKVLEKISDRDVDTKAIHEFNVFVKNDSRVEVTILPLRDGVSLIRKL